jgi:hypothetical protein
MKLWHFYFLQIDQACSQRRKNLGEIVVLRVKILMGSRRTVGLYVLVFSLRWKDLFCWRCKTVGDNWLALKTLTKLVDGSYGYVLVIVGFNLDV